MRLHCSILKDSLLGDCSCDGISSRHNRVLLVWGEDDPPAEVNGLPVVKLVERQLNGPYLHAQPVAQPPKGRSGYMFGGCFITTSDGRFPNRYPIPLHDRAETL